MPHDGMVLRGYACLFDEIIDAEHGPEMLCKTALNSSLCSPNRKVEFWLNHEETLNVGSTDDCLTLYLDRHGLAFQLEFPDTPLGEEARSRAGRINGASIGFKYQRTHEEVIDGKPVLIIDALNLNEISLVYNPDCKSAFALLYKPDRPLSEDCESGCLLSQAKWLAFKRLSNEVSLKISCLGSLAFFEAQDNQ